MLAATFTLLATLSTIAGGCHEPPLELLGTGARPITGGSTYAGHPAVGMLQIGSGGLCTGTLIGDKTVLTAAHCIEDNTFYNFVLDTGETINAASAARHPQWAGNGAPYDFGLVLLAKKPQTVASVPVATSAPTQGLPITLVGYGSTYCGVQNNVIVCQQDAGIKRRASNTIASVTSIEFTFVGNGSTCKGDSGGPAFATLGGKEVQIGVTSRGQMPCGQLAYDGRVDAVVDWIRQAAGGDVNDGADGTPPQIAITTPADGAQLAPGVVVVKAQATDDSGVVPSVSLLVDGQGAGSKSAAPFDFSVTLAAGTHQLQAVARDGDGNEAKATITITVVDQTVPPPPPPDKGAFGDACSGPADCESGLCAYSPADQRNYCTQSCSPSVDCPRDADCLPSSMPGHDVCGPPKTAAPPPPLTTDNTLELIGSCALSPAPGRALDVAFGLAAFLALVALRRRRCNRRALRAAFALGLLATAGACSSSAPATVLLDVSAPALAGIDALRLTIFGERGVELEARRLPATGAPELPSRLVLYPPATGELRLLLRAYRADNVAGEGAVRVTVEAGRQVQASLAIEPGRLADRDGDGVPDSIDRCPDVADPDQTARCAGDGGGGDGGDGGDGGNGDGRPADARPDGPRDGAHDARPEGPTDGAADGLPADVLRRDVRLPDVLRPDTTTPVTITVMAPASGAQFAAGSVHAVQWKSTGLIGPLRLELLKGGALVKQLAANRATSGSYNWSIDPGHLDGSDYRVRLVDAASGKSGQSALFTVINWRYRLPVTVDTSWLASDTLTDHPVLVRLTPANFNYGHARSDGSDLRASTSTKAGAFDLDLWLETWNTAAESRVWIRMPQLSANTTPTVQLYTGNATATTSVSSEAKVFTAATSFVSAGNSTATGNHVYSLFQLQAGHTLTVGAGTPLRIEAQRIIIAGTIDGTGAGYAGGGPTFDGSGPGAGQVGTTCGGSGAGHGGAGGAGGYDPTDVRSIAGVSHGDTSSPTISMGSGGGGASQAAATGGAGGGALTLVAESVVLTGTITLAGAAGTASNQAGGGGAGGGLLVVANALTASGVINANGGDGGSTPGSPAYDGGGGAGGGRIKLLTGLVASLGGTSSAAGGLGGAGGDASGGDNGAAGTIYSGNAPYSRLITALGPETTPTAP